MQVSRRLFNRIAAGSAATLPFFNEAALAQLSYVGEPPADAVMINSNEFPLGPCAEALEAMNGMLRKGGRYFFGEVGRMGRILAEQEGLKPNYSQAFAGSSDPLHRTVMAFSSPARCVVAGDPGYEAVRGGAAAVGAELKLVPLTKSYAHDVKAMLAAGGPNAGVFYLCNPNNPTGTLTSRADMEYLLKNKPAGSILLLDEAYIHFSTAQPCTDWVAADKDVIILRTFSKIYGMAGLRAGAALGRPDLLAKLRPLGTGYLPTTGMVGAATSLQVKTLVPERRKMVKEIREDVFDWMTKKNYKFVPSESNKFMVDTGRPGRDVFTAMAERKVYIGRTWPVWPNHVRVSIGTREEMEKFKAAFAAVMA